MYETRSAISRSRVRNVQISDPDLTLILMLARSPSAFCKLRRLTNCGQRCVGVTQEVCYTQTFPTWSVMTMATTERSAVPLHTQTADVFAVDVLDETTDILVRKGCVSRTVNCVFFSLAG